MKQFSFQVSVLIIRGEEKPPENRKHIINEGATRLENIEAKNYSFDTFNEKINATFCASFKASRVDQHLISYSLGKTKKIYNSEAFSYFLSSKCEFCYTKA
jgi:hypothetical protein